MERSLATFTIILIGVGMAAAALLARRAPAVTYALIGALIGGVIGSMVAQTNGPYWLPSRVSIWASVGLAIFGLVGACVSPVRQADLRFLARAGWVAFALAPVAAIGLTHLFGLACPYFEGQVKIVKYCFYADTDLFGGWPTAMMTMFWLDGVAVALLFWISAWLARPER